MLHNKGSPSLISLANPTALAEDIDGEGQSLADRVRIKTLVEIADASMATGDIPTALLSCEQLVRLEPKNATFMSNLGVLHIRSGNMERAVNIFSDAYALAPHDQKIRNNFLNALCRAATEQSIRGNYPLAIKWIRTGLALDPSHPSLRIELTNALGYSGQPAVLGDFIPGITPAQLGKHLLIACMPKSGSTFLKEVLCTLTGCQEANLSYAYIQYEHEIYLPHLLQCAYQNTVTQQHCRASKPNEQILQAFDIRPIVLVRNLPDVVISYSSFLDNGAVADTFFGDVWPTLNEQGKYDLIIDHVMPWYAGFYASWERAQRLGRLNCLFVTYEEMVADKPATIARIASFLDLKKTSEECATAVRAVDGNPAKTRFNKGIVGRGDQTLSPDQKARLRRLVTAYGDVDLERIGMADIILQADGDLH